MPEKPSHFLNNLDYISTFCGEEDIHQTSVIDGFTVISSLLQREKMDVEGDQGEEKGIYRDFCDAYWQQGVGIP